MKTRNSLSKSGPAIVLLSAGVLILATGCVEHRVTHVNTSYPVSVAAPVEPAPAPPIPPPPPGEVVALPPAPPAPPVRIRSAVELGRMLGPIALYPDPLLAQILPAATLPEQVVLADRYLREGGNLNIVDDQAWDHSVKALARYPATLRMMDDNLAWTTDLGQAFLNQPADVMDAVQRLRARARLVGNLESTPQQVVVVNDGIIEILPAAPQVIYVPVYQPEVVYVQRPPGPGRFHISFGAGFVIGAWLNHDCDWHHHQVIVWHRDHPRPGDWWSRPPARRETPAVVNNVTVVNNTTIVNQNFTVWRPQDRSGTADRAGRGGAKPDVRTTAEAVGNQPAKPPQTPVVAETQRPAARPTAPVKEPRPTQAQAQPGSTLPAGTRPSTPAQGAKPAATAASREPRAVPQRPVAQPSPVVQQQPRATRPTAAQPTAPVTAGSTDERELLAREVNPAARPKPAIPAPKDPHPTAMPATRPGRGPAQNQSSQAVRQPGASRAENRGAVARPTVAPRPVAKMPSPKGNAAETSKPQAAREN